MNRSPILPFLFAGVLAVFITLTGCSDGKGDYLERVHQFSLDIGKAEDQVDLLQLEGSAFDQKVRLFMRDGQYYLSNGASRKVMRFSSYGDLIGLYYNQERSNEPVLVSPSGANTSVANRRAFQFPFMRVGEIAVSSTNVLFAEDSVPSGRGEFDEELGVVLDRIVLRIDAEGRMIDYLGQEGTSGTPFPYIEAVRISTSDEVAVICRAIKSWFVFWYSSDGLLLYKVEIPLDQLPVPEDSYVPVLDTVDVDPEQPVLYLMINYYAPDDTRGDASDADLDFASSRVFSYDLRTEEYGAQVDVPQNMLKRQGNGLYDFTDYEVLYELVGVASGGFLFLLSPADDRSYQLAIVALEGTVIGKYVIDIADEEVVYRHLIVTPEGILAAFLGGMDSAGLYSWRTDSVVREAYDRARKAKLRR